MQSQMSVFWILLILGFIMFLINDAFDHFAHKSHFLGGGSSYGSFSIKGGVIALFFILLVMIFVL